MIFLFVSSGPAQEGYTVKIEIIGGEKEIRTRIRDILEQRSIAIIDSVDWKAKREDLMSLFIREGYWSAEITGPWIEGKQFNWRVSPGPVWSLDAVRIETGRQDSIPSEWLTRRDRIRNDLEDLSSIRRETFLNAADDLLAFWEDNGHPFASVMFKNRKLEDESFSITLKVDPGPLVVVKEVSFPGEHQTRPEFLRRIIRSRSQIDRPYKESQWKRGAGRLLATGLFSGIDGPRLEILPTYKEGIIISRVVYRIEPSAFNNLEAVAGYSGRSETLSGLVHITLGNLFGTGRSFNLVWERREKDRTGFHLRYEEPFLWRLPIRWHVEVEHLLEDTLYTRTDFQSAIAWEMDDDLWMDAGLRHERNVAAESLGGKRSRTSSLFGLRWEGLQRDPEREKGLSAGIFWSTGRSQSFQAGSGKETVHEIEILGEARYPVPLLGVGRLLIQSAGRILKNPIPMYETYLIGGSNSLRGYREEAFRVIRYGVFQLEAGPRLGPGGARFLFFLDTALILPWDREEEGILGNRGSLETQRSYGIGIRSLSRRGLVRIDYGVPWGEDPTAGRLHVSLNAPF